jgi:hypothetical protein
VLNVADKLVGGASGVQPAHGVGDRFERAHRSGLLDMVIHDHKPRAPDHLWRHVLAV